MTELFPGSARALPVTLRWASYDGHRRLTGLAATGLGVAVLLAVVGLPPVDLHGPLHRFGLMDPLCGGTRAARYAVQGQWAASWRYNPLGLALVAGAVTALARSAIGAVTGRWLNVRVNRSRPLTVLVVVAVLALEIRQQLLADLLMTP